MPLTFALSLPTGLEASAAVLDGVTLRLDGGAAFPAADGLARLAEVPHLLCHSAFVIERLGFAAEASRSLIRRAREQKHLDVAELFAFVCPARFATPTPKGLARSLNIDLADDETQTLGRVAEDLLSRLANPGYPDLRET